MGAVWTAAAAHGRLARGGAGGDRRVGRRGRGARGAPRGPAASGRPSRSRPSRSASGPPAMTWPPSSTWSRPRSARRAAGSTTGSPPPTCSTPRSRLQLREAGADPASTGARAYRDALVDRALEHRDTLCAGRTHGVHAEPTTFGLSPRGLRLRGGPQRRPARARLRRPSRSASSRARSAPTRPSRRRSSGGVMEALGLRAEDVSTQVVPRDRHAEVLSAIALAGRRARALRDRGPQPAADRGARGRGAVRRRPEGLLGDAAQAQPDPRRAAQRDSRGCCAGYAQVGLENVALWHERDISHSGAERVVLPDATILLDYMQHLAARVVARDDGSRRAHARQPRAHPRRPASASGR